MDTKLASVRNAVRLTKLHKSTSEVFRIAQGLDESISKFKAQRKDCGDVCCPLPFSLQDLCLLVVISDLDCHQVKVLATLPHWLRRRLLTILPALDLCHLEHTPLAGGVDVDVIWNSRWKEQNIQVPEQAALNLPLLGFSPRLQGPSSSKERSQSTRSFFEFNVGKVDNVFSTQASQLPIQANRPLDNVLRKEIKSAFQGLEECELPHGKQILLKLASDILTNSPGMDLNVAANKLISIQGDMVFPNLLTGSLHHPCPTSKCGQRVWKKQATALGVNVFSVHFQERPTLFPRRQNTVGDIQLTPHRLLPILYRRDPLELLTLLTRDCSLQPSSANLHIESISQSFLLDLCAGRLALDSGFSLPSDSVTCTLIVNKILEKVLVLRLRCDKYGNIGVMIGMIEAAIELKHLFCTMPNTYMDMVQPFSTLFSLQNFQQLTLEVDEVYPLMLSKLLQGFMTAPCPHTHKLMILTKKRLLLPTSLKASQLAALGAGSVPSPSCSAEHKILEFCSQEDFTSALYLLLQLPIIRLREMALVNYQYLHLCAIHPDLQTTKLVIDIGSYRLNSSQLATIQTDLVSLFKMASLRKIFICGNWGGHLEVKLGLVQGLRSRSHLPPLRKVVLELELGNSYKMRDLQMLSDAIFSLPQLENLKVVLGKGFADMLRQPGYEGIMYKSWIYRASKVKLKSICLLTYKRNYEQLSLTTHKLSFSSRTYKPTPQDLDFSFEPTPQENPCLDFFDTDMHFGATGYEYFDDEYDVYYDYSDDMYNSDGY